MKIVRLTALPALLSTLAFSAPASRPLTIAVDAREVPRKIFHARLTIPAAPGPLTLLYPKWLPGEHMPTGPIADLAGLRLTAAGKPVPWRRDLVDMYAFHVDVPEGADALDVSLDFLSTAGGGQFSSGASATPNLAMVSWNQLVLYPKGARPDELVVEATLELPAGWKSATALERRGGTAEKLVFEPVSLTTLVDSPVLIGSHVKVVELAAAPIPHRLDMASDSDAALEIRPEDVEAYRKLVAETGALFGARHYRHYDFLLTLSDHVKTFGLEHHQSSDDRVSERALVDDDKRRSELSGLLPHEMVHSWNGKYRRPLDLSPGSFEEPMRGDLLWVYEGLTQYLGEILTARAGLLKPDEWKEQLAINAAAMDVQKGRAWRPLQDTADAAQILYGARSDGATWRRGVDFYPESSLLWLEADMLIREKSGGAKSLDDFCRAFHGGETGAPNVVTYTFDDVVAALEKVVPNDWRGFWRTRLASTETHAPLAGLAASGWRLSFTDKRSSMVTAAENASKTTDARFSIGFAVGEGGAIDDVIPDSPAAKAGVPAGSRLVAVNGRKWSAEVLRDAITRSKTQPIELLVESGDFFRTHRLDYAGGERYPRLERDATRPDTLSKIIGARSK